MGRPVKEGLDYFELDCQLDDKIKLIQAEIGLKGFAIVVKLFQRIYGGHGYYCEWNDDTILLFMSENGLGSENKPRIKSITDACIRRKLFSEELYTKYQILTSSGIQKRYLNAVSRRENVKVEKAYLLVDVAQNQINVSINPINVDRNPINADRNTQRRVEKSREENNKNHASLTEKMIDHLMSGYDFSSELSDAIHDWVYYKAEKNQKYKETGFRNLLSQISAKSKSIGEAAVIEAIRGSMSNNYQGIIWDLVRKPSEKPAAKKNRFNNFHQRDYDFQDMESRLLNSDRNT